MYTLYIHIYIYRCTMCVSDCVKIQHRLSLRVWHIVRVRLDGQNLTYQLNVADLYVRPKIHIP